MNIVFDKVNDSSIVTGIPLETTKMLLTLPEYTKDGSPDMGEGRWVHTASAIRQGTLIAVKEEPVENPVFDEGGNQIDVVISTEVTVLESQAIDLKVL